MLPGTEGAPDDFDALMNDLGGSEPGSQPTETSNLPDVLKPSGQGGAEGQPSREIQFAGRKYADLKAAEKVHNKLYGEFSKERSRVKQLEGILKNPKFHEYAAKDPEIKEAMAKAGLELALEREGQAPANERVDEYDESNPLHRVALLEARMEYREELMDFQEQLGRKLTGEERKAINDLVGAIPRLSVAQAWKLTPHYEKQAKNAEDRRFADISKKAGGNRPKPTVPLMAGQKIDMKKPVTEMNDAERRTMITDILGGSAT